MRGSVLRSVFQLQHGHNLSQSPPGHLLRGCQRRVHASGYTRIILGDFSKHRPPLGSTPGDSKLLILEICSKNLFLRGSQVNEGHQGEGCSPLAICHLHLFHSQLAIWSQSKLPGQTAQDLGRQSVLSGGFPQPPLCSLYCTETSRGCCQSLVLSAKMSQSTHPFPCWRPSRCLETSTSLPPALLCSTRWLFPHRTQLTASV